MPKSGTEKQADKYRVGRCHCPVTSGTTKNVEPFSKVPSLYKARILEPCKYKERQLYVILLLLVLLLMDNLMIESDLIQFIQEWFELVDGSFFWKKSRRGGIHQGQLAGKLEPTGYRRIQICGKAYYQHRLVWLMYTGSFPQGVIDHINHDRSDNRFLNLRDVSRKENQRNRSKGLNNSSGVTGVCWNATKHKWMQYISAQGSRKTLGYYPEFQEAVEARKSQEKEHGYHENHGC